MKGHPYNLKDEKPTFKTPVNQIVNILMSLYIQKKKFVTCRKRFLDNKTSSAPSGDQTFDIK